MAINYTYAEAVKILSDNIDKEAIKDIGRRFPLMSIETAKCIESSGETFVNLMAIMPDYLTAGKVNKAMSMEIEEGEESTEEVEAKPAAKAKAETKTAAKPKAKQPEPEDEEESPYDGMSAMELYKECKSRKLKADPKKPAKYYLDILMAADAAADDAEDEGWEEEEAEEKPKTKAKPAAKPAAKPKAKPKAEEEDDEWDI